MGLNEHAAEMMTAEVMTAARVAVPDVFNDPSVIDRLNSIHERLATLPMPFDDDSRWMVLMLFKAFQENEELRAKLKEVTSLYVKESLLNKFPMGGRR